MVSGLIADTIGLSTVFVVSAGMSFGIGALACHPLVRRS